MLTKNLLRYRKRGDGIFPQFLQLELPENKALAESLLQIFADGVGKSLGELEEAKDQIPHKDRVLLAGLFKLLVDKANFGEFADDLIDWRLDLFVQAQAMREEQLFDSLLSYQEEVALAIETPLVTAKEALFADLPHERRMVEFTAIAPEALLDLYNQELIAALLLHATKLKLTIDKTDLITKRHLIKSLKFHGLMFEVLSEEATLVLEISGPLSLFAQDKSYGAKFSHLLPHILLLERFHCEATLFLNKQSYHLQLDESVPMKDKGRGSDGYQLPEVKLVLEAFNQEPGFWQAEASQAILNLGEKNYVVPDIALYQKKGERIEVELFHRWHKHQLTQRLQALMKCPLKNLKLGVEKSLTKSLSLAEKAILSEQHFFFKDFPTVAQLKTLVDHHS